MLGNTVLIINEAKKMLLFRFFLYLIFVMHLVKTDSKLKNPQEIPQSTNKCEKKAEIFVMIVQICPCLQIILNKCINKTSFFSTHPKEIYSKIRNEISQTSKYLVHNSVTFQRANNSFISKKQV